MSEIVYCYEQMFASFLASMHISSSISATEVNQCWFIFFKPSLKKKQKWRKKGENKQNLHGYSSCMHRMLLHEILWSGILDHRSLLPRSSLRVGVRGLSCMHLQPSPILRSFKFCTFLGINKWCFDILFSHRSLIYFFFIQQELDGICNENNWILPTYRVSPSDGKIL